jgi:peptidoglycan hydrolase-like protein with peptidoglycan-binding domain
MKRRGASHSALRAGGELIGRNPVAIGGALAFAVTFAFFSANALWYQPHAHPGPLFRTRVQEFIPVPVERPETLIQVRNVAAPATMPAPVPQAPAGPAAGQVADLGDPEVLKVQQVLAQLRLYDGTVDGINGPQTREAVMHYQRVVGLDQTGRIDEELLRHLGIGREPPPVIRPPVQTASAPAAAGDSTVMRIQAALRAFGNSHIEVDGIAGKQTQAAIREFQSLFGLEVDGIPDEELLEKMRDLGMVD